MQHFDFNNPVCILTGDEFLPKPGMTFAQQILEFFQSQGGLAHSPWGEVLLDMKGIQSDKSHGIGRIKAASFVAIKDVLEKKVIISGSVRLCSLIDQSHMKKIITASGNITMQNT